jgi:hypothetical protein
MKTLEIVVMIWTLIINFYGLISKISGTNHFIAVTIKFLCLISFIYFGAKLINLIP